MTLLGVGLLVAGKTNFVTNSAPKASASAFDAVSKVTDLHKSDSSVDTINFTETTNPTPKHFNKVR